MGLRLSLPREHPTSWVYPALLVCPPVVLLTQRLLGAKFSNAALWSLAVALGLMAFALFAFIGAMFLGH